jgi:hypothetical protein
LQPNNAIINQIIDSLSIQNEFRLVYEKVVTILDAWYTKIGVKNIGTNL